jgi:hypothetical protein
MLHCWLVVGRRHLGSPKCLSLRRLEMRLAVFSKTKIVGAYVDCIIDKDKGSIDTFSLSNKKVERIVAIFIVGAVKFVLMARTLDTFIGMTQYDTLLWHLTTRY